MPLGTQHLELAQTDPIEIAPFPSIESPSRIAVTDFLGHGTACLVWSSSLPAHAHAPLRYLDLMSGQKPWLLSGYSNGRGKQVAFEYRSSTHYYLDDKMSDEDKAEVNARIEAVREALKGEDQGAVDSTKGRLAEVLQRVGTKAYEATGTDADGDGADGASGPEDGDAAGPAAEDAEGEGETIEGEYKEV